LRIRGFLKREPGLVVSGTGHAAILVASLVAFASAKPFADQQESVAVEMITPSEYTAMTRGDRNAKDAQPEPKPKVDKVADTAEEKPQSTDAPRDVPAPPSRPPAPPAEKTEAAPSSPPPPAPPREAKAEPPKPTPPKPEPAKVEPPKPDPAKEAELKAEPPKRPDPPKEAEKKPDSPKRPEPQKEAEAKPEPKKPEPKKPDPPKPVEKPAPKREELAKLIEASTPKEKPAAKPAPEESKFNPSDIQKLLQSKEKAQSAASTGREVNRTASIGTRTGNSPKLSLSQRDAIGNLLKEQIYRCFNAPLGAQSVTVKPMVKMELNPDGTLAAQPVVMNSSSEAGFRPFAESLARAIRRCAPYHIPAQFAPYYADWRDFQVIADPSDFLG
jgi:hypothetical protein